MLTRNINLLSKIMISILPLLAILGVINFSLQALHTIQRGHTEGVTESSDLLIAGSMTTTQFIEKNGEKFPIKVYFHESTIEKGESASEVPYNKTSHYINALDNIFNSITLFLFYLVAKIKYGEVIFTTKRMKRLQWMGIIILLSALVNYGFRFWLSNEIMPQLLSEGTCTFKENRPGELFVGFMPFPNIFAGKFIVGTGLIALAQIFKAGVIMQEDQKLII